MITSLRSIIIPAHDLSNLKEFYTHLLGKAPYFDEPYYVGFDLEGREVGLDPQLPSAGQSGPYPVFSISIPIEQAYDKAKTLGAYGHKEPHHVGGGLMMALLQDPGGNMFGILEEPSPQPMESLQ